MNTLFYISGAVAVIAAGMVVTRRNAMHALVYLVLVFLAIASMFFTLGAPFAAVLQIVIYAGAIMVLFVFAVLILDLRRSEGQPRKRLRIAALVLPLILAAVLLVQFVSVLAGRGIGQSASVVGPKAVGISLFTDYLIGVELSSLLLIAGLVAGFHFGVFSGRREEEE